MAENPNKDIPAISQVFNQQDSASLIFRTPKRRKTHELPNQNTIESSLVKKKIDSVLASTKRKIDAAGAGNSKRNLLSAFEDSETSLQVDNEGKRLKKDPKSKTSTTIITVTIPQSRSQSPEPTTSSKAVAKPKTPQRQLPDRSAKSTEMDQSESAMSMKNLKKALDELDSIEVMKIYNTHFVRQRHFVVKPAKPKPRKKSPKPTSLPLKAYRSYSNTSISSTTSTSGSLKTYYCSGGEGEEVFDECPKVLLRDDDSALDWDTFLEIEVNWRRLHPVEDFPFAPLKDVFAEWAKIGLAVEVPNLFAEHDGDGNFPYWCGTIIHFGGYKAVIQLQDLDTLTSDEERKKYRVYLSLLCGKVKPLRWAFRTGSVLDPGPVVVGSIKSTALASKLDAFYFKSDTISSAMMLQVENANYNRNFGIDSIKPMFAALCPKNPNEYRFLDVINFIGDRLQAKFAHCTTGEPQDFYGHYKHRNVVPFMHGPAIGAPLKGTTKRFESLKPSPDSFPPVPEGLEIKVGMALEVIHPKQPDVIVVAKITKVYKYGYFEVETAGRLRSTNCRRIYHVSDPHVLPMGFAARYRMPLDDDNRSCVNCPPLDLSLLPPRPQHSFEVGDKFEAVYLMAPDFVGPVTVVGKSAHLVCVHFDGWTKHPINFQWMDPLQDEAYPSGYCETFGVDWKGNVAMII